MVGEQPQVVLQDFERRWRPELERVSLVAELELTKQDLNLALYCVASVWKQEYFADRASARIVRSYPASFVVAVSGSASIHLAGGGVLPAIFEAAGMKYDANLGRAFGRTFVQCLEEVGLPTFPELDTEAGWRYVNRMLLHGGVPLDHLDEFFNVAEDARRRLGDVSRSVLQAWMVQRADEGRLHGATKTVERFLRHGEDFAADFLDRALELLDRVRDGDNVDDIQVGLPRRYVERAIELRDLGELPGARRRREVAARVRMDARPEVRFDPYVLGVHLYLPPVVDADGPVTWHVDMGERSQPVTVRPPRPGLPTPSEELPLPPMVATVEVRRQGIDPLDVRIVDLDDPHLLFDHAGARLERTARLPQEPVWSVRPSSRELVTGDGDGPRVVEDHDTVARWPGWIAQLIDLNGVTQVGLDGPGRMHQVAGDASARLDDDEPLEGARSQDGHLVLTGWPRVVLPPAAHGASWDVSVARLDGSQADVHHRVEVDSEAVTVDLHAIVTEALTGVPVRVRARGPLGRSLRQDLVVVPDLRIATTPTLRTLQDNGLAPARVEVAWAGGALKPFVLESSEASRAVDVGGTTIVVSPPAVAVEHIASTATGWGARPVALSTEQVIDDPGSLAVKLPGASRADLELLDTQGSSVQTIRADGRARADGARRFDLSRFTDTLRSIGAGVLRVDSDVWRGRVANIVPAALVTQVAVSPDRGLIEFMGVQVDGVSAAIYRRLAPTLDPLVITLRRGDNQVALPDELDGVGPLRVLLRIDDPWVPQPWPRFAHGGTNTFDLDGLAVDLDVVDTLHPLAPYLAGVDADLDLNGCIGDALHVYTHAHHLRVSRTGATIRAELADALPTDATDVLVTALDAEIDGAQLAHLVVSTGMVATQPTVPVHPDRIEQLWTRWPGAGFLAACPTLDDENVWTFLRSRCGAVVNDLLDGQQVDVLCIPRVDEPRLLEMNEATLAMLRTEAGIAPKQLLDPDFRVDDGFRLVRCLQEPSSADVLRAVLRDGDPLLEYLVGSVLADPSLHHLRDAVQGRMEGESWQLIPAISLAAALGARLAPRSQDPSRLFTRQARSAMTRLVSVLPGLVAADLIMAELALLGSER